MAMIESSLSLTADMPGLPPFIQENHGAPSAMLERFNFWSPDRFGDDHHDYIAGGRHFRTALAFSHQNHMVDLLMHIVSHMCQVGVGAIEEGFIAALSEKATYGGVPEALPDSFIKIYQDLLQASAADIRQGEIKARAMLNTARQDQSSESIRKALVAVVNGDISRLGHGTITFLHTVCRAAYLGAAN